MVITATREKTIFSLDPIISGNAAYFFPFFSKSGEVLLMLKWFYGHNYQFHINVLM